MKAFITSLCVLFAIGYSHAQKILYIGNSYTYLNDTPAMLDSMARAHGFKPEISKFSKGGATMKYHINNAECNALVEKGGYDYIILQSQSVQPALVGTPDGMPIMEEMMNMINYVRKHNPTAKILLQITWGREHGNDGLQKKDYFPKYPHLFTSYESMQQALDKGTRSMAHIFNADGVIDVGKVWSYMRNKHPEIYLYGKDGSHPGYNGSYLATSVIFTHIYNKKVDAKKYHGKIDTKIAKTINNAVWENR
jgi:hypothetical protein